VPYAGWLAANIPPVAVRLRRDFATLLALVETHAIIHQLDRETDEHGLIVATTDDYLAVREFVANLMSDAVGTTVKATVRQTVEAITQLAAPEGVTVKQLADRLQLERSAAQYRVQAARDGGFIVNIEDRRGMPARYALDNPLPAEVALLPETIPEDFQTRTPGDPSESARRIGGWPDHSGRGKLVAYGATSQPLLSSQNY
jgi:Arc/MetJ family transcription regulator